MCHLLGTAGREAVQARRMELAEAALPQPAYCRRRTSHNELHEQAHQLLLAGVARPLQAMAAWAHGLLSPNLKTKHDDQPPQRSRSGAGLPQASGVSGAPRAGPSPSPHAPSRCATAGSSAALPRGGAAPPRPAHPRTPQTPAGREVRERRAGGRQPCNAKAAHGRWSRSCCLRGGVRFSASSHPGQPRQALKHASHLAYLSARSQVLVQQAQQVAQQQHVAVVVLIHCGGRAAGKRGRS